MEQVWVRSRRRAVRWGHSPRFLFGILGLVMVGPLYPCTVCCHNSSAAWAAFLQVQPGCGLSESSTARKAAEAVSTKVSGRAERGCPVRRPAVAAPRIMSRMRGLATSNDRSPFPSRGPAEPSWSSQLVLQLHRSSLCIAILLVVSSLALLRPLVALPAVQLLEPDNPHHDFQTCHQRRETFPAFFLQGSLSCTPPSTSCTLNLQSRSSCPRSAPAPKVTRPNLKCSSVQSSEQCAERFQSTSLVVHTPRYPCSNSGEKYRGSRPWCLTVPSKTLHVSAILDSHTRMTHLKAFHSPFEHSDPNKIASLHTNQSERSNRDTRFDSTLNLATSLENTEQFPSAFRSTLTMSWSFCIL